MTGRFLPMLFLPLALAAAPGKLVAHRGCEAKAPENTLPAYELAWRSNQCWGAETDVYLTADDELVCIHDADTERTSGIPGDVRKLTLAVLRQLDVGKWKGPRWLGTPIPTLREVLSSLPADKHLFIEIKAAGPRFARAYRKAAAGKVRDDQITIISFHAGELEEVHRELPGLRTLLLSQIMPEPGTGKPEPSAAKLIERLRKLGVTGVDVNVDVNCISASYVAAVHAAGFEFHVWGVNEPERVRKVLEFGADSVTASDPDALARELETQSR